MISDHRQKVGKRRGNVFSELSSCCFVSLASVSRSTRSSSRAEYALWLTVSHLVRNITRILSGESASRSYEIRRGVGDIPDSIELRIATDTMQLDILSILIRRIRRITVRRTLFRFAWCSILDHRRDRTVHQRSCGCGILQRVLPVHARSSAFRNFGLIPLFASDGR